MKLWGMAVPDAMINLHYKACSLDPAIVRSESRKIGKILITSQKMAS